MKAQQGHAPVVVAHEGAEKAVGPRPMKLLGLGDVQALLKGGKVHPSHNTRNWPCQGLLGDRHS